jgi:hypothetical protein
MLEEPRELLDLALPPPKEPPPKDELLPKEPLLRLLAPGLNLSAAYTVTLYPEARGASVTAATVQNQIAAAAELTEFWLADACRTPSNPAGQPVLICHRLVR